jgi:hypothetical protein
VIREELKPMLRIAGPVILAELGWMGMAVVDTIMVGPLGPAAIGAVGVGNSLHFAIAIFGMGLFLGLDMLVAQASGGGRLAECRAWLKAGAELAAILSPVFIVVAYGVKLGIPHFRFHPQLAPLIDSYFGVLLWSTPALLFYAAFRRYLQGMHFVTPVMFALVSANLVNAGANWALIYGNLGFPALGVPGSAWATLISRIYMAAVLLVAVWRHLPREKGHASVSMRKLLALGFPAASQITLEVGVFAASSALAGKLTPIAVASHQITMNIIAVAFMVPLGLSAASRGGGLDRDSARHCLHDGRRGELRLGAAFVPRTFHAGRTRARTGLVAAARRGRVSALRRHPGRGDGGAARHRRHADADDYQPCRSLVPRTARRLLAVLRVWLRRDRSVGGATGGTDRCCAYSARDLGAQNAPSELERSALNSFCIVLFRG